MSKYMQSEKIWSFLGKLALVLTVIWIIIQITNHFSSKEYNLKAYGSYEEYHQPEPLFNEIKKDKYHSINPWNNIRYIFTITLKNESNKEIKEINLEVPLDGFYQIIRDEKDPQYSKFYKKILIGSLRPANELKIIVWSTSTIFIYGMFDKSYRFTYPDGVTPIEFSLKVTGFLAWMGYYIPVSYVLGIVLLIILVIVTFFFGAYVQSKYSPPQKVEKEGSSQNKLL